MRRSLLFILTLLFVVLIAVRVTQFGASAAGPQRPALIQDEDVGPSSPYYVYGKTAVVNFGPDSLPDYAVCIQSPNDTASAAILGYYSPTGEYRRLWQSEVNRCAGVVAVDSVGDGRRELFVLGRDGFVTAYDSADGRLLRRTRVTGEYESTPDDLAAGDVDGDGRPEIVVVNQNAAYVLSADLLNLEWEATGKGGSYVFAGNFDGDSDIELLIRDNHRVSFLLDAANRAFDGEIAADLGPIGGVGDVDGDPQTEILHTRELRAAVFDPTTGADRWSVAAPFGAGFVDMDNNGRVEAVVGKGGAGAGLDVFAGDTGDPTGTIPTPGYVPVSGQNVADLDGDGTRELIWIGQSDQSPWQFFIGDLAAAEVEAQFGSFGVDPLLILADLDGDGIQERIVANLQNGTVAGERVSIFDGRTGSAEPGLALPDWYEGEIAAIGVGQMDDDPAREIVVARTFFNAQIVLFDGATRQLQREGAIDNTKFIIRMTVANMDADATDEIIIGYKDTTVEIVDGATGAVQWSADAPGYELADIAVGDADGDGARDLAVLTKEQWLLYRGPSFDVSHQEASLNMTAMAIGNRDQLGPGEILLAAHYRSGEDFHEVRVYHGQSLELITTRPMPFLNDPTTTVMTVADFDADGVQEYAIAGTVDDPETEQGPRLSFLMIDNYYNALPWPEYSRVERLGWPALLVAANADDDPQIELAFSGPFIARLFDIRVEDFVAHTSHVPITLKNWPRPVEKRFFDPFTDPAGGWPVVSGAVADLFYSSGRYNIRVHQPDRLVSVLSPAPFTVTDYTLDVDARSVEGSPAFGVLFDWTDWDNYNAVLVAPDAESIGVFMIRDGEMQHSYPWHYFPYLESGNNHFRIERENWGIRVIINGQTLGGVALDANGENVRTGLVALALGDGSETAAFDNFDLREKWWTGEPPGASTSADLGGRGSALWRAMPIE